MGAIGAVAEPLVVVTLLFGGTYINRDRNPRHHRSHRRPNYSSRRSSDDVENGSRASSSEGLLDQSVREKRGMSPLSSSSSSSRRGTGEPGAGWRKRTIGAFGRRREVVTPDTTRFQDRMLSRLLERYPFLVECWYWALIYWVYQLGRAFTATMITTSVVDSARSHALTVIEWEQALHIFYELPVQQFFLLHPRLLTWINRIYSFIHIPGSIAFLVWLFYYTTARNRRSPLSRPTLKPTPAIVPSSPRHSLSLSSSAGTMVNVSPARGSPSGPALYQSRRRTMALCNLLAFVVFTLWPCMPPRLLSDPAPRGIEAKLARSFGFVDTVHGKDADVASVWTQNRFCNQFAAMPSLHFGYALLIGLTIMSIPLAPRENIGGFGLGSPASSSGSHHGGGSGGIGAAVAGRGTSSGTGGRVWIWMCGARIGLPRWDWRRALCVAVGVGYPALILVAIVATANHFILDAVAGACVVAVAFRGNEGLLNLLPVEDWFLWTIGVHKPALEVGEWVED